MIEAVMFYLVASYAYGLAWATYAIKYDCGDELDPRFDGERAFFLFTSPFWFWLQFLKYLAFILPDTIAARR